MTTLEALQILLYFVALIGFIAGGIAFLVTIIFLMKFALDLIIESVLFAYKQSRAKKKERDNEDHDSPYQSFVE